MSSFPSNPESLTCLGHKGHTLQGISIGSEGVGVPEREAAVAWLWVEIEAALWAPARG